MKSLSQIVDIFRRRVKPRLLPCDSGDQSADMCALGPYCLKGAQSTASADTRHIQRELLVGQQRQAAYHLRHRDARIVPDQA